MNPAVKFRLPYAGEEYPATLERDENGAPKRVALTDPAKAPLELIDRVELMTKLMGDGGWPCIRSLAPASPRFLPLVERISEACGEARASAFADEAARAFADEAETDFANTLSGAS